MGYRDDLEAALERADALERDLARAKSENDADHERIAELERQLKEARKNAPKPKSDSPSDDLRPTRSPRDFFVAGGLLAIAIGIALAVSYLSAPTSPKRVTAAPVAPKAPPANGIAVSAGYNSALAMAQEKFPDARLARISAEYVDPAGVAEISYGGEVRYRFVSPSHANQPPPTAPVLGAPATATLVDCRVSVYADRTHKLHVGSTYTDNCDEVLPAGSPHCTVEAIWQKAIDKGAPAQALATIELRVRYGKPQWRFQIQDQARNQNVADLAFSDDCN